jgi:hypothetical protein
VKLVSDIYEFCVLDLLWLDLDHIEKHLQLHEQNILRLAIVYGLTTVLLLIVTLTSVVTLA